MKGLLFDPRLHLILLAAVVITGWGRATAPDPYEGAVVIMPERVDWAGVSSTTDFVSQR